MKVGETDTKTLDLVLSLHGVEKKLSAEVLMVKTAAGQMLITNPKPLLLDVADYNLVPGLEKLKEVAGLPSIDTIVPVSVKLVMAEK